MEWMLWPVLSGSFTIVAGVMANLLYGKFIEQKKIEEKQVKDIADTVSSKANEAKAKAIEAIAERFPLDGNSKDVEKAISQHIQIGGNLVLGGDNHELSLVQDLVNGYHQQALSQAKVQFWFSVFAATVGFSYILFAAMNTSGESLSGFVKVLPGVVIDAVALLFFRQAEQTRERATALYDRLREDNQMSQSRELVESIEDLKIKSAVKAQIALHMAGLKPKEIDLPTIISPK